jgi:hypothetical protein
MAYLLTAQIGFILLSIFCIIAIYWSLKKTIEILEEDKQESILLKYTCGMFVWVSVLVGLSLSGFFSNFSTFPPRMFIVFVVPAITLVLLFRSPQLDAVLANVPPAYLLKLQFFRVIVEVLLWVLFLGRFLPERMTFEGYNFDIVAGVTGPVFAYLCFAVGKYNKKIAIIWNVFGLLLLLNIVVISMMTIPSPLQVFINEDCTIMSHFPIVLLPGILVPLAYYMHFLSLRQLLRSSSK